ncbi:chemotaxis signal transduction protein CheV [Oceanobacillus piezotolerans]|uniref:Chemotaxis signal transduction protein CheV n=1 Tax=Oceanobacillus piezotolerans TaxID=2448030 RepID=A0A498D7N6_9BACI|nr:chemotaxis protein [Oceanobacillus piezotolerans]RLL46715.1 chemotaxis signal transduction protein CheV [Oceanobacillus piezotolerans]
MDNQSNGILLESGTNELEVILFGLGRGSFAINVLKTREIITPLPIMKIPNSHQYVEGVISLRGEIIPVVKLSDVIQSEQSKDPQNDRFIVAELNGMKIAFRVHSVNRIQRISWEQIEKPNELSAGKQPYATGIIKFDQEMSILLDIERIVVEINPDLGGSADSIQTLGPRERSAKRIVVAEDSAVLRSLLIDTLSEAGYENVKSFQNGREAWEYLVELAEDESTNPTEKVQLLLTDIEMPQMDGHHLTLRVKQHARLKELPVIIFSSLITDDLFHKGEKVGASAQVSKPKLVDLVKEIDKFIL